MPRTRSYPTLRPLLPPGISRALWGDRARYGRSPPPGDPTWLEWQRRYLDFYLDTQKEGVGAQVNDAGYRVLRPIALEGLRVLEIGPGNLTHHRYWRGRPALVTLADLRPEFLEQGRSVLERLETPCRTALLDVSPELPFPNESFDLILSFYNLEHLHPLPAYLDEILRVLAPQGRLVGAIPCEGGLAWGTGRYLTSRRWLLKNTAIDPDKLVCWEHPNLAGEILQYLDARMRREHLAFWPLAVPIIDLNLVVNLVYAKHA